MVSTFLVGEYADARGRMDSDRPEQRCQLSTADIFLTETDMHGVRDAIEELVSETQIDATPLPGQTLVVGVLAAA